MKRNKFIIALLLVIVSISGQKLYSFTQIDKDKAYDVCMKYHHADLQSLCERINSETLSYEDILGFHNGHSQSKVEETKNEWTQNGSSTKQSIKSGQNINNDNENKTNTPNANTTSESDKEKAIDRSEEKEDDDWGFGDDNENDDNKKEMRTVGKEDKEIITKSYTNYFWQILNIIVIIILVSTFIVSKIKAYRKKQKIKSRKK